jgi:single-strand DNA-binding protein
MKTFGTARLGSNMEIRSLQDGTPVGSVSLAFKLGIKDKAGEYKTQWVSAAMFGKRAESIAPYLKKGNLHAFHLRDMHLDEFVGKDGEKRVSIKATIDDVELCGKPTGEKNEPRSAPEKATSARKQSTADDFPDDLPFAHHGKNGADVSWRNM